ncbi:MAG TPA: hypothetical protein VNQ79_10935 [Blastocatellia bacterium]|nr:hypothetical protein [Blastocatellia bacterium]
MKTIHQLAGLLIFIIFLLMGGYMRFRVHHLMEASDRLRFSLRGNHIYTLWAALLNLTLGSYLKIKASGWRAKLQLAGSLLVLLASALVIISFFFESKYSPERPITLAAVVCALTGTFSHCISTLKDQSGSVAAQSEKAKAQAGSVTH